MAPEAQESHQEELFQQVQADDSKQPVVEEGFGVEVSEVTNESPSNSDLDDYYMQLSKDSEQTENSFDDLDMARQTMEESMSEEPLSEEPLSEELLSEEPLSEEPLSEEPLSEELLSEEPLSEELLSEEPLSEESSIDEDHELMPGINLDSIDPQAEFQPVSDKSEEIAANIEGLSGESNFHHESPENDLPDLEVKSTGEEETIGETFDEERPRGKSFGVKAKPDEINTQKPPVMEVPQTIDQVAANAIGAVGHTTGRIGKALLWDLPKAALNKGEKIASDLDAESNKEGPGEAANSKAVPAEQSELKPQDGTGLKAESVSSWDKQALDAEFHSLNKTIENYHSSVDSLSRSSWAKSKESLPSEGAGGAKKVVPTDSPKEIRDIESLQKIIKSQSTHLAKISEGSEESQDKLKALMEGYKNKSNEQLKNIPDSEEKERIAKSVRETIENVLNSIKAMCKRVASIGQ